ncbi:hypothetical protein BC777_2304 [Yoonia maricola]|uniref:Uncharacterized protein n=1 Tax=Yoonia maricola TaxID=420999 RepID=A0A2M8W4V1_9RHOB|nr:hypothetical protein BC777_2304 [Yoonia maricola]
MSQQSYLIDTKILIGLEDNHTVEAAYPAPVPSRVERANGG